MKKYIILILLNIKGIKKILLFQSCEQHRTLESSKQPCGELKLKAVYYVNTTETTAGRAGAKYMQSHGDILCPILACKCKSILASKCVF